MWFAFSEMFKLLRLFEKVCFQMGQLGQYSDRMAEDRFPAGERYFLRSMVSRPGLETNPHSYQVDTKGSFPGGKTSGA
jgi:hypothetical protein